MQTRSGGSDEGGGASRRSQRTLMIGLVLGHGGGAGGYGEPRVLHPDPTFLFIALHDGGHQPGEQLGSLDQGMDQAPN